jgi:DNA polymerase-3 subunit delta
MTFEKIISDLRNRVFFPIYFLQGEETYYIDEITDYIQNHVLDETEREFNQTVVYGNDVSVAQIVSQAKAFPMLGNHQVVIVKEAQNLKKIDDLVSYAENPQNMTLLVLAYKYKKLDGRKKLGKVLKKNHVFFEAKKLYDNKVPSWIVDHLKSKGYGIHPAAAMMLSENLGNELKKIANEIEKLFISLPKGHQVTELDIEENIGISREFNVFELQRAIGSKDVLKVNRIIRYFASDPKRFPILMVLPVLFNYFSNLMIIYALKDKSERSVASALSVHPFFVGEYMQAFRNYPYAKLRRIIGYLRDYDLKAKGINNISTSDGDLLKEMMFKILH